MRNWDYMWHIYSSLCVTLLLSGCDMIPTQEKRLIAINGGSINHRIQIAQQYATDETLGTLRARIRTRFPGVTEADVSGLELSWQRLVTANDDDAVVVVTFTPRSEKVDAIAIADYCADVVAKELEGMPPPASGGAPASVVGPHP